MVPASRRPVASRKTVAGVMARAAQTPAAALAEASGRGACARRPRGTPAELAAPSLSGATSEGTPRPSGSARRADARGEARLARGAKGSATS